MGFLSSLLGGIVKVGGGIVRGLLGIAPKVAPSLIPAPPAVISGVAGAAARATVGGIAAAGRFAGRAAGTLPGQLALAGGAAFVGSRLAQQGVPGAEGPVIMGGGVGRGNGRFARQTIVETIDLTTGTVVRQEVFSGAPFLLNSDVRKLRQTTRKLTRAAARIPRRSVPVSLTKQLTDAALNAAIAGATCPPKG